MDSLLLTASPLHAETQTVLDILVHQDQEHSEEKASGMGKVQDQEMAQVEVQATGVLPNMVLAILLMRKEYEIKNIYTFSYQNSKK